MTAMNKQKSFKSRIKRNRKELLSYGFLPSTLTMWATGQRTPRRDKAEALAKCLNIAVDKIPQRLSVIR
jgi:hypothetical protein